MSSSIIASGVTRGAFYISTNDLEINGDVIATKFIGSGEKLTNINLDNINKGNALSKIYGGTNNNIYINQGIVFNNNSLLDSENKLTTSSKLLWNNQENILYINGRDIVTDSSNYVKSTSNILLNNINITSNIIINDIFNHIENTLGIDNTFGIPIASTNKAGIVKVGEGLFMTSDGFLSMYPEDINIPTPSTIPNINIYNLILIEDTCESLGSKFKNKYLGTFGRYGTYSFFVSHQLIAGEGGMLVCDNKNDYDDEKYYCNSMECS